MYSIDNILITCADIVARSVGEHLSKFPDGSGGTRPAVFLKKAATQTDGKYTGLLPYCVITSAGGNKSGATVLNRYVDQDCNEVVDMLYTHDIIFNFVGGDAEQIASSLEQSFQLTDAIRTLQQQGYGFVDSYGVNPNTTTVDGVLRDFSSLAIRLTTLSTITQSVDTLTGLEGTLTLKHFGSDVDIMTQDFP